MCKKFWISLPRHQTVYSLVRLVSPNMEELISRSLDFEGLSKIRLLFQDGMGSKNVRNLLELLNQSPLSCLIHAHCTQPPRIFWPVNCTPERCVNLRQKIASQQNSVNLYWAYLLFWLAYLLFWLVYLVSSALGWCAFYMRWSIQSLECRIWYFHKKNVKISVPIL